ncbi:hypothetical protein MAQ5080_00434 [Marinomonas aquimarina]|uniref:UPF0250 protein MAQ5080_00434 n=1 Tax=Marinomonas aquimarina TaxID=295068 RepID=A0A1A8T3V9_9GAMM|nr:DUF493 domain-containing protein [Marinomonas aquimarina]SBS26126.1 hypothetical protein MAQ5080_00434 [Marinomonas aquimarina]
MTLINKQGVVAKDAPDAPKIEFPCANYLIKVVAMDADDIHIQVVECVLKHAPDFDESSINKNVSSKGRFVSFSFRINAESEDQLARLHKDLMVVEAVKMVM